MIYYSPHNSRLKCKKTECSLCCLPVCFNENTIPFSCREAPTVQERRWDFNTVHVVPSALAPLVFTFQICVNAALNLPSK